MRLNLVMTIWYVWIFEYTHMIIWYLGYTYVGMLDTFMKIWYSEKSNTFMMIYWWMKQLEIIRLCFASTMNSFFLKMNPSQKCAIHQESIFNAVSLNLEKKTLHDTNNGLKISCRAHQTSEEICLGCHTLTPPAPPPFFLRLAFWIYRGASYMWKA